MLFFPTIDVRKLPKSDIERIQLGLLKETLRFVKEKSPFYKSKWKKNKVNISSIRTLDDLRHLPFTLKEDIQRNNWDFLCVPKHKCLEVVATTGTTGTPVFFALTRSDLERLAENEKRCFELCRIGPGDTVQIAVNMDNLFIAGSAYYHGLLRLGAKVVRTGMHRGLRQLNLMRLLQPDAIVTVPYFLNLLSKEAREAKFSLAKINLRKAILIGESIRREDFSSNPLARRIEERWGAECFSTYGITEIALSFCECHMHTGNHSHPEMVIAEVVDEKGVSLPDGAIGELVLTSLQTEGMPLVRYKTGDVTFKITAPCKCGYNSLRIGPIIGRKAQRLKVKGTTTYPKAIENILLGMDFIVNYIIEAYNDDEHTDKVVIKIGVKKHSGYLINKIKEHMQSGLRFTPEIKLMHPEEIHLMQYPGNRRKPLIFIDKRKI